MNKTAKKAFKITGIVLGSIVGAILLLYAVLWIIRSAMYGESMDMRQYVCNIPEINSGFVPQGIGYSKEQNTYIMTGYNGDDETVMYLVKDDHGARVHLHDSEGNALKGHGGGVTCTKDYVYIANAKALTVYSLSELMEVGGTGEAASPVGVKYIDNSASYCFSDDERLYVGEFYRAGNYETPEAHHYTTPSGDINRAVVFCYPLDGTGAIAADHPDLAISVTGLVQGFAVSGNTYMLSRSYGLSNSKLEYYGIPTRADTDITVSDGTNEKVVPLYYLDSSNIKRTVTLPSFSEDLAVVDDRVVVTTEAACNKYFIGKLFGAHKVYSYPIL